MGFSCQYFAILQVNITNCRQLLVKPPYSAEIQRNTEIFALKPFYIMCETVPRKWNSVQEQKYLKHKKIYSFFALGIVSEVCFTAQKMQFSINDFSSKCDQIRIKLRIWSYLLEKSLMENCIFCAVLEIKANLGNFFVCTSP